MSVRLAAPEIKKATTVKASSPSPEYQEIFLKDLDYAWRHSKTGETIGLFTECNPENDKSLTDIRRGLLNSFDQAKILSESTGRAGSADRLRTLLETSEYKTKSYTDLAIYKNESCVYIATHVSVQQGSSSKAFDDFLKGIEGQL